MYVKSDYSSKHGTFKKLPFPIPYNMVHYSTSKFVTRKDSEIPDLTLVSSVQDNMKSPYLCFIEYWISFGKFHILHTK